MKKILSITLISALALVLSTGCSSKSDSVPPAEQHDAKISEDALYIEASNGEIIEIIKVAADNSGWEITEFKSNEIIAEKTADGETISSVIKIYDGYIEFENENTSDLRDALEDAIKNDNEDTH